MTSKNTAAVEIEEDDLPDDEGDGDKVDIEADTDAEVEKPGKPKGKAPPSSAQPAGSAALREIRAEEDESLKGALEALGPDGSFKIHVTRLEPEEWLDPQSGRRVKTLGKLKTYTTRIDEDFIADRHGGGKYLVRFMRRNAKGSYQFVTQRTIDIAGDPRTDDVPRTSSVPGATAAAAPGEHPSLVKEAFQVMREQLDRSSDRDREPRDPRGIDPTIQVVIDQFREDGRRRDAENAELRIELAETRKSNKPVEDPIKDEILRSMMGGERGHVEALRLRYESELRMAKDAGVQDQQRIYDRHDRELLAVRQGFEREISAIRSAHEVALASAKASYEMQVQVLNADIRRLERDNTDLRSDIKDLRARKDKTIVETVKDLEAVKNALGLDGEGGEKSNFDKFLEVATSPAAAEFVQRIIPGPGQGAAAAAPPAQAIAPQSQPSRQLVQDPTGQKFLLVNDGKGRQQLVPVKKKPKVIPATTNADGTVATPAVQLPEVDPAQVALLVGYLERAFAGNQEPEIVAQSGRTSLPEEILTWIRDNDSGTVSGVDLFMKEVAKLPSTSPLTTQLGKNWLRRVGKALVGE